MDKFVLSSSTAVGETALVVGDREIVLEKACTFKTFEAAKMVGKLLGALDIQGILGQLVAATDTGVDATWVQALLAQKIIPMIADEAPDALIQLAALAITPNEVLKKSFRKPNGVAKEVEKNVEFLLFDAPGHASIEIVTRYVPYLGLDDLKDSLAPLLDMITGLVTVEEVETES